GGVPNQPRNGVGMASRVTIELAWFKLCPEVIECIKGPADEIFQEFYSIHVSIVMVHPSARLVPGRSPACGQLIHQCHHVFDHFGLLPSRPCTWTRPVIQRCSYEAPATWFAGSSAAMTQPRNSLRSV